MTALRAPHDGGKPALFLLPSPASLPGVGALQAVGKAFSLKSDKLLQPPPGLQKRCASAVRHSRKLPLQRHREKAEQKLAAAYIKGGPQRFELTGVPYLPSRPTCR